MRTAAWHIKAIMILKTIGFTDLQAIVLCLLIADDGTLSDIEKLVMSEGEE